MLFRSEVVQSLQDSWCPLSSLGINEGGLCRDRTYDPVIKSRIAIFNFVKAFLHSLSEPANAFSASHRALPTVLRANNCKDFEHFQEGN